MPKWVDQHPRIAIGASGAAVVAAIALAWASWPRGGGAAVAVEGPGRAFFSADDGQTWFADDAARIAPFEKDGKEALRAYVFRCGAGEPFVAALARYTPSARKELEAILARRGDREANPLAIRQLELDGLELKAPGRPGWIKRSDPRAAAFMSPRCPDGSPAGPVEP